MNQKEAEKILATRYSPRALITVKLMTDNPHRGTFYADLIKYRYFMGMSANKVRNILIHKYGIYISPKMYDRYQQTALRRFGRLWPDD